MRALWVPPVATRVLGSETPVLVMLRDPLERFASSMRQKTPQNGGRGRRGDLAHRQRMDRHLMMRFRRSDATWAGMYATQLEVWATHVGRGRMMVLQYEKAVRDPQAAVDAVWRRLGLDPVPLHDVDRPSSTSSRGAWEWPEGLRDALAQAYRPEVERLSEWWIDTSLWDF
jgi:hypothetical protein